MSYTTGCFIRGPSRSSSKSDLEPKSARLWFNSYKVAILLNVT